MSAGQPTRYPPTLLRTRDVEDAATWEPIRPPEGIYRYHHGCGHGRTSKGRR